MKKIVVILICMLFIGSSILPSISCLNNNVIFDEIDQKQDKYDGASTALLGSMLFAQSFKPGLETLTRVELLMNKLGNLYGNSILSIRESLSGEDLTSVSKESLEINSDMEWIEFDFPDITVNTGDSYYIVLKPDPDSDGGWGFNFIGWAFGGGDSYQNGDPYEYYNGSWSKGITSQFSADYTFKTFGINNYPPNKPIINSNISGIPGTEYQYTFVSIDPERDDISYYIDWGDNTSTDWTRTLSSGEYYNFSHIWFNKGDFTIKAKAKDKYGQQTDWSYFEVTMPKSKVIFQPLFLQKLFQCFPFFEKILKQYL